MRQLIEINHVLEVAGPRGIAFRPAYDEMYNPAQKLASLGNIEASIVAAEDAYIAKEGNMHGISFRVVTTSKTISVLGSFQSLVEMTT